MNFYRTIGRPTLLALALGDVERAHWLAIRAGIAAQMVPGLLDIIRLLYQAEDEPVDVFGRRFRNPLGVAAGVDKNAHLPGLWEAAGFGFYEAGTVTPLPQVGNIRPRLYAIPQVRALLNALGFNNDGARAVRENVSPWKPRVHFPIAISLGTRKETPKTVRYVLCDYGVLLVELYDYGDFFVVNISSPNTKGLRGLQDPENVRLLVRGVVEQVAELAAEPERSQQPKRVLVKFAPDFPSDNALIESVQAAVEGGASGVILFNTTQKRPASYLYPKLADKAGGYSGPHTIDTTIDGVGRVHQYFPDLPIIGVGGINSRGGFDRVIEAGAVLAQVNTAIGYGGLGTASEVLTRTH